MSCTFNILKYFKEKHSGIARGKRFSRLNKPASFSDKNQRLKNLVGSAAKPIISGGQRKRVSIGIELVVVPMALARDEPTSGLDATSASSTMMTLKELSRSNITVITIIHQPRAEIFESLEKRRQGSRYLPGPGTRRPGVL
ncbi:MAG: hypothetical protein Q9173_004048 [Seirophora scorigena]